jgi:hypothetical protein
MAEDAFGDSGTGYSTGRQESNGVVCGGDISQRLMAHMLGLEAPGVDPLSSYYLLHSRGPFVAGDSSHVSYPSSAEFTNGCMQAMNPVVMSGDVPGPVGGNWSHTMAADNYGINNANYMYDFGEYGV